jgi:hypothetical protein
MTLPNRPTAAQETQSAYAPAWELGCSSTRESHCRRTGTWDANTVGVVYSAATGNVDPSSSRRMQSAAKSQRQARTFARRPERNRASPLLPLQLQTFLTPSITALIKNRHGYVHLDKPHPRHLRGQCRPPQVCGPRVVAEGLQGVAQRSRSLRQ